MGKAIATEEGMSPMGKGRHRYAKGDYAGALAAFTEVSTPPSRLPPVPIRNCPCMMISDRFAVFGGWLKLYSIDFDHFTFLCSVHMSMTLVCSKALLTPPLGCKLHFSTSST
jgi:hypothetical protein